MSSRKEVIRSIAIVEGKLLRQQAVVNQHLRFLAGFIQYCKPLFILCALPLIVLSLKKMNVEKIAHFGKKSLNRLFSAVRPILQTLLWTLIKRTP